MRRFETLSLLLALAIAGCNGSATPIVGPTTPPSSKGIQHIVILMQENRSFDNLFAGFPGADTTMQGLCKPSPAWCKTAHEVPLRPVHLATGSLNLGEDIDHSHRGFKIECDLNSSNVCQNDGFDLINKGESGQGPPAKLYPYAYVYRSETAPYWNLARQYSLADRMFSTDTASSFIAHQQIIAGTVAMNDSESLTDQPDQNPWGCDAPPGTTTPLLLKDGRYKFDGPFPCFTQYKTIADLLDPANISYQYYVYGLVNPYGDFSGAVWNGFDAIKKFRYSKDWKTHISSPNSKIFSDIKAGTLPQLSIVIPTLYDSDHPAGGCDGGPWWITRVVNAVGTSQYWKNTAIIVFWDDWGGWYDNVPPPQVNYTSLGFRVPLILVSPYAKPHHISHTEYDIGSILKFVEQTFGLGSLGTTDAKANSLADSLDLTQKPNTFTAAPLPHAMACKSHITNPSSVDEIIKHDGGAPE